MFPFIPHLSYCAKLAGASGRWHGEALERMAETILADFIKKGLDARVLIDIRDNTFSIAGPGFGGT